MTSRKTSLVLAAAAALALGGISVGEPADRANSADQQGQSGQAGQQGQGQQGQGQQGQGQQSQGQQGQGQQADAQRQINQLLAQIAADPNTAADKLFVLTAALHNQSEMQLAKEVLQKTQNEQVKRMAQQMLDSLQKTHQQLQQTAQAIGLQLPQELAQAAVQEVHIIAALPADQLDKSYTSHVQADNAQDLSEAQSESQIAQDPQVRRFAQDQVSSSQDRSRDADQTAQGLGMKGGRDAQPAGATIRKDSDSK
jgi:predicted outer membrane protein